MATVVDSLLIALGLDTKGVDQGMKKAEGTISGGIKKIMGVLGPLVGAMAFKSGMDNFVKTADALGKTADRIGVNIQDLDAWGMAVQHAGGSAEGFQNTLEGLNMQLQNYAKTGKGRIEAPMKALGIAAKDAAGQARQPFEVLEDLAAKAHEMDAAQFAGLAAKLGLDKGTIGLLQQGGEEVDRLVKRMKKLAYTEEDRKAAEDYNDAMQDMQRSFTKVANQIFRVVVPAFTWLADKFTSVAMLFSENKATLVMAFAGVAAVVLSKVIPALKSMDNVWMKSKSLMTISAIVAALGALYMIIEDFVVYCQGGQSALEDLWSVFGTGPEIIKWFEDAINDAKKFATQFFNDVTTLAKKFVSYFSGIGEPIKNLFMGIFELIHSLATGNGEGIKEAFKKIFSSIGQIAIILIKGAIELILDLLNSAFSSLGELAGEAIDWIGEALSSAYDLITEKLGAAWEWVKGAVGGVYDTIVETLGEAWDWVKQKAFDIFNGVFDFISGIFSRIGSSIMGTIKSIVSKFPDFLLPDSVKAWAASADETIKEKAPAVNEADKNVRAAGTGMVEVQAAAPKAEEATRTVETTNNVDSHSETTIEVGGITVTTQATDAQGTANAIEAEFEKKATSRRNGSVQTF